MENFLNMKLTEKVCILRGGRLMTKNVENMLILLDLLNECLIIESINRREEN